VCFRLFIIGLCKFHYPTSSHLSSLYSNNIYPHTALPTCVVNSLFVTACKFDYHLSSHACPLLDSHTALLACVVNSLFIIDGRFHYHNISSYLSCLFLYFSSVRVNSPSLLFDHDSLGETSHDQGTAADSLKRVRQAWKVKW